MGKTTLPTTTTPMRPTGLLAVLVAAAAVLWPVADGSAQSRSPRYRPAPNTGPVLTQFDEPILPSLPAPEDESAVDLETLPAAPDTRHSPSTAPETSESMAPVTSPYETAPGPYGESTGELFDPGCLGCNSEDPAAAVYSSGTTFWRGNWFTQLDFVTLYHSSPHPVALGADTNIVNRTLVGIPSYPNMLKTTDNSFRYEPGMRLTAGRILGRDAGNRDHYVEFSYLGGFDWSKSEQITATDTKSIFTNLAPGGLPVVDGIPNVPVVVDGFSFADRQAFQYTSELDSFEINFRFRGRPGRDIVALQPDGAWVRHSESSGIRGFLFGLRFMTKDESLLYTSSADEIDNPNAQQDFEAESGSYQVDTSNDMIGPQLGIELLERYDQFYIGGRGKAGLLVNFADRTSTINTAVGETTSLQTEKLDDEHLAAVLEAGVMAAYQIRPYLALRVSYDAMYITGVAQANDNLALPTFPVLNVEGDTIYHGLSLGIERLW